MERHLDWRSDLGDATALAFGNCTWTHHQLHVQALRLTDALVALGLRRNARVLVVLPNSPVSAIVHRGVLLAGSVVVPLSPGTPPELLLRIAAHSDAEVLISTQARLSRCKLVSERTVEVADAGIAVAKLVIDGCAPLPEEDLSYLMYSSGTTAAPKGVAETFATTPGIPPISPEEIGANTIGCVLPFYHGMGRIALFRMWAGCKLVLVEPFDAHTLLDAIQKHRINRIGLVPSMGEALLRAGGGCKTHDLSSLTQVMLGGAPVPPEMPARLQELLGGRVIVGYGLTEGGNLSTAESGKVGSVGRRNSPGQYVRVVGTEGLAVPDGDIGEVQFESHRGQHYYKDSEATARTFCNGWVRTGDLGYFDADGDLFLVGRVQELILQGGVNVIPQDVEEIINRVPGIRECAVAGVPDNTLGEQVVAFVVSKPGHQVTAPEVLAMCRLHLDERKIPVAVHFVETLPRTELGKVKKYVLREQFLARQRTVRDTGFAVQVRAVEPLERRNIVQQAIRTCLADVLGDRPSDPDLPLGQLGVTSLTAVRAAHDLSKLTGLPIPATICFEYPSVSSLTEYVLEEICGRVPDKRPRSTSSTSPREPIAIIGMGCRFPHGAHTPEHFWQILERGTDCIQEVPPGRWDMESHLDSRPGVPRKAYTKYGAFLQNIPELDARSFGMSPAEARKVNVYESLALQVAAETYEDAGYDPFHLPPDMNGVYLGSMVSGGAISGAISYRLNLRGPSLAIDSECASSLAAVHAAVQGLRKGECDTALAGGIFVLQSAAHLTGPAQLGLLSADGRCRTFDAAADGIGMGEGCGFVLLKRLSDAERDKDRIVAVVRGSSINHGGRSTSPTAPNVKALEAVMTAALKDGDVEPGEVGYVETHGTGTSLGDPIEVRAISLALAEGRREPLVLGALKTNFGHLQAAAGIAGLMKAALVVGKGVVPPNLHFQRLNPLLEPYADHLVFPTTTRIWPAPDGRRRVAGVTSMGLSGFNAHVVLEQPEERYFFREARPARSRTPPRTERSTVLVPASSLPESPTTVDRLVDLLRRLRICLEDILDAGPEEIDEHANLLDLGMDSLRLVDFLEETHRITGIRCQPSDFMSRPRLREFASYLAGISSDTKCHQLIALREHGSRPPLFCMHAIGGEVTPYLRLSTLLGPQQPSYAIQSECPGDGVYSITRLATTYSGMIQARRPAGPIALLGWSMGAILANAVARSLEQGGRFVSKVFMLDPPHVRRSLGEAEALALALISSIYALNPSVPPGEDLSLYQEASFVKMDDLLAWCIEKGLLGAGLVDEKQFRQMVQFRLMQIQAVSSYSTTPCRAPLRIWWAGERDPHDWSAFSLGECEETIVPATHFSIVRAPAIEQIAWEIREGTDG